MRAFVVQERERKHGGVAYIGIPLDIKIDYTHFQVTRVLRMFICICALRVVRFCACAHENVLPTSPFLVVSFNLS